MKELTLNLGANRNLVAVVTLPSGVRKPLGLLLLNAGVVHRVGPCRTSVKLARHLAGRGYTTVRFDLAGIGDSRLPPRPLPFREQALRDVQEVIDYLEQAHELRTCAVYGICAGAVTAYWAGLNDERISGIFMLDGYAYPTPESRAIQFASRLRTLSVRRIPAILKRELLRLLPSRFGPSAAGHLADVRSSPPGREQFAAGIQRMVDRGARVTFLYSGSVYRDYYCYPAQLGDAFRGYGFPRQVTCHYVPAINHLVTTLESQRTLLSLMDEWMSSMESPAI